MIQDVGSIFFFKLARFVKFLGPGNTKQIHISELFSGSFFKFYFLAAKGSGEGVQTCHY